MGFGGRNCLDSSEDVGCVPENTGTLWTAKNTVFSSKLSLRHKVSVVLFDLTKS